MRRILIIEDNHSLLEEIINVLDLEGFIVETAENGRVGFERLQQMADLPDIVICDLWMPDWDGYEMLKAVRGHPATVSLPVIVLTAHDDKESQTKAKELGADDFVTKPFKIAELLQVVERVLKKAKAPRPRPSPPPTF
jgi:DNA-binding response OmpR family regulator